MTAMDALCMAGARPRTAALLVTVMGTGIMDMVTAMAPAAVVTSVCPAFIWTLVVEDIATKWSQT